VPELRVARVLGRLWLRLFGWTLAPLPAVIPPKFVVIAAPHTSAWDLPFMLATAGALGIRISWFGKHTLFSRSFGWLLRSAGGIPIDRRAPHHIVRQTAELFRTSERLALAIPPEGTRRRVEYWKSGFYYIALDSGVPIGLGFLDYERRRAGLGPLVSPTGDVRRDMEIVRAFYRDIRGRHCERESPPRLREEDAPSSPVAYAC
jgi:1-acyl-sn-glycerol-3-phosphate acyltransferase